MKIKTMMALTGVVGITAATGATFAAIARKSFEKNNGTTISKFENLIKMMGVPQSYGETRFENNIPSFSDLGAWHAHSLPDRTHKSFWGGFTQPFVIRKYAGRAIAKSLDVLKVWEYELDKKGNVIQGSQKLRSFGNLPKDKSHFKQYPGGLWQEFQFDDITVQLDLRYVQNKTSFVRYNIINHTNSKKAFQLIWTGKAFKEAQVKMEANAKHSSFVVPVKSASGTKYYKPKYNKYGQTMVYITNPISNKKEEAVLYATEDKKGLAAGTRRGAEVVAVGTKGHAPDTENQWYVISNKIPAAYNWFGTNALFAYKDSNQQLQHVALNTVWDYKKSAYAETFVPDIRDNNQSKNSLKIKFLKPYAKNDKNFLSHEDDWQWDLQFQKDIEMNILVANDGQSYEAKTKKPFVINANGSKKMFVGNTFTFTAQERFGFVYEDHGDNVGEVSKGQLEISGEALQDTTKAQKLFNKSVKRWQQYIKNLIGNDSNKNFDYQKVAVKAMETLVNNWRGNAGMLEHQGVTPSLSINFFNEFWSWDTWKQATAEVNFDPKLAIDNMKVMFDYQVTHDPQSKKLYNYSDVRQKNDVGMIPDLVAYQQGETNWRDTKPPLAAWGAFNVINTILNRLDVDTVDYNTGKTYKQLALNFGKYIYNRLIAYHLWWYSNRDADNNAIAEYGGTIFDGSGSWVNNSKETITTAVAWESGMDNAPRFDQNGSNRADDTIDQFDNGLEYTVKRNADGTVTGYVLQQESVDLNSYMYAEKSFIIKIGKLLKKHGVKYNELQGSSKKAKKDKTYKYLVKPAIEDRLATLHTLTGKVSKVFLDFGTSFEKDEESIKKDMQYLGSYINNKMFDKKTGFFYDLKWKLGVDGKTRDVAKDMLLTNRGAGPEGLIPLWANAASEENAKRARDFIMSTNGFNTHVPFPTAAYNNEKFEPDQYWRGPVWLDQAYFGVQGLHSNGFERDASYMAFKLFHNAKGVMGDEQIRENYNPLTGEGLNAHGFSWSSGMYLLMYEKYVRDGE